MAIKKQRLNEDSRLIVLTQPIKNKTHENVCVCARDSFRRLCFNCEIDLQFVWSVIKVLKAPSIMWLAEERDVLSLINMSEHSNDFIALFEKLSRNIW
jgi:hypothetical protein